MTDPAQEQTKSLEQRLAHEPQSPLFARLAAHYLQAGRAKDALRLCDDGLAHYPFYTTAHLVKGKALIELGMMAEAKHEYEVVHELLPTSETVAHLCSSIDSGTAHQVHEPAVEEKAIKTEAAAPPPSPVSVAEPPIEKPQAMVAEKPPEEPVVTEESVAPFEEEPPAQELAVEEAQDLGPSEVAQAQEDSFGAAEPVAPEEPPGAAEKLGVEMFGEPAQQAPDFGFGSPAETPVVEETAFGSQPMEEPLPAIEPTAEQAQEPSPVERPETEEEQAAPEAVASPQAGGEGQAPDWFEAFDQLQQMGGTTTEIPAVTPAEEENPFAMFGTEQPSATVEGEPYEDFTARIRMELFGTEDTMTLDEYFGQSTPAEPPSEPESNIGELAEKLKTSPRITPPVINFADKAARSASEADASSGAGIVTPTLAEIYVKQGWYDDAIKAYAALAANKPAEKEKYEQRIAEIEEMKKTQ
jgi:hypothetical protein